MGKDRVEVYMEIRKRTELAVLCFDGTDEVWLPKSMIEMEHVKDDDYNITMPEWLAIDKEII